MSKWTQDLDVETLDAKGQWAMMEELLQVVTLYFPRYENTVNTRKTGQLNPSDLIFATKIVAVYLFIKVKGSRPMSYQYLKVGMVKTAKENGGFIYQKNFKTASKYAFESLILTTASIQVLESYVNFDFVLVTRNGGQHSKLDDIMSKQQTLQFVCLLVFIGIASLIIKGICYFTISANLSAVAIVNNARFLCVIVNNALSEFADVR